MAVLTGRPKLDTVPGFKERFATLLPRLREGTISKGEAARRLNISHRSLTRYLLEPGVKARIPET